MGRGLTYLSELQVRPDGSEAIRSRLTTIGCPSLPELCQFPPKGILSYGSVGFIIVTLVLQVR